MTANATLRVNPDVDAGTHPYISTGLRSNKFGIPITTARELYRSAASDRNLVLRGIDCHIGSQILSPAPLIEALSSVLALVDALAAAITPRTRAIVTVSPNNPTGAVWPERVLKEMVAIAQEYDLFIIADEIYQNLVSQK